MNVRSAFCLNRYSLLALLFPSLLCCPHANAQSLPPKPIQSRQDFVERARRINPGDSNEAKVEAILGKPDYIGHIDSDHVIGWFYGCEGAHKLPTLGVVCFDEKGVCNEVAGTLTPPPVRLISEKELREALLLIDQAPTDEQTDPGAFIRVVNQLAPLGKDKVIAAIREYDGIIRSWLRPDLSREWKTPLLADPSSREAFYSASKITFASRDEGPIFLIRALFDIPGEPNTPLGETLPIPYPRIGALSPAPPLDHTLTPRFPVILVDDVPLINLVGIALGGRAETVTEELPFFEKDARVRTQPLHPTDHPEEILEHLTASSQWFFKTPYRLDHGYGPSDETSLFQSPATEQERALTNIKEQILKLLAPLYPTVVKFEKAYTDSDKFVINVDTSQWDAIMADLKKNPVRWNPTTEEYERLGPKAAPIGK